jgi:hypothetical protein
MVCLRLSKRSWFYTHQKGLRTPTIVVCLHKRQRYRHKVLADLLAGEGGCNCKNGSECHCATPRKTVHRSRKLVARAVSHNGEATELYSNAAGNVAPNRTHSTSNMPLSSHILARIAELRPVLPRPMNNSGPLHDPSSGIAHGSGVRHHTHENMFFSPYSRAYGHVHHSSEHISYDRTTRDDRPREAPAAPQQLSPSDVPFSADVAPITPTVWRNGGSFPSLCGCGDICSCPGCVEHDPNAATARARNPNVFASCTNPGACSSCLDCTILSLPSAIPPDTILSIYGEDETHTQSIDEWIASLPSSALPQQQPYVTAPPSWDSVQVPRISEPTGDAGSDSDCKCPPGSCTCEASYCGFCQGCACEDVDNREQLTFAVSGERGECQSEVEKQIGVAPTMARTNGEYLSFPSPGLPKTGSGSSSSLSSQTSAPPQGLMGIGRILPQSSTSSLVVPTSNVSSRGSPTIATPPPLSRTTSSNDGVVVYAHSNPDSDPSRSEYNISSALYAVSNPDSDHSHEEYEYRQSTGAVYALSNPDSELSHEEFDYDPRFDFPPAVGTPGTNGENLAPYATSNPDSEQPPLEDLEKFEYDPSLDGMQIY